MGELVQLSHHHDCNKAFLLKPSCDWSYTSKHEFSTINSTWELYTSWKSCCPGSLHMQIQCPQWTYALLEQPLVIFVIRLMITIFKNVLVLDNVLINTGKKSDIAALGNIRRPQGEQKLLLGPWWLVNPPCTSWYCVDYLPCVLIPI